jgi:hypothetical protein
MDLENNIEDAETVYEINELDLMSLPIDKNQLNGRYV